MKNIFVFWCLVLGTTLGYAQDHKSHDQIRSLKIAHLTSELELTPAEAEKFWPLYHSYDQKMYELRHNETTKLIRKTEASEIEKMSEKEAEKALNDMIKFEAEYFAVRKQFILDVQKIISAQKIIKLKKAEDDFNKKLLKQYRKKK